jgi:hypothetical protein
MTFESTAFREREAIGRWSGQPRHENAATGSQPRAPGSIRPGRVTPRMMQPGENEKADERGVGHHRQRAPRTAGTAWWADEDRAERVLEALPLTV